MLGKVPPALCMLIHFTLTRTSPKRHYGFSDFPVKKLKQRWNSHLQSSGEKGQNRPSASSVLLIIFLFIQSAQDARGRGQEHQWNWINLAGCPGSAGNRLYRCSLDCHVYTVMWGTCRDACCPHTLAAGCSFYVTCSRKFLWCSLTI